jgi:catechol 2,3-dioxygenase-like lactoylglutathione lyase family enzyme
MAAEGVLSHVALSVADLERSRDFYTYGLGFRAGDHGFGGAEQTGIVLLADPDYNRGELVEHPGTAEAQAHSRYLGLAPIGWPAAD